MNKAAALNELSVNTLHNVPPAGPYFSSSDKYSFPLQALKATICQQEEDNLLYVQTQGTYFLLWSMFVN